MVVAFIEHHPNLGYGFESRFFCRRSIDRSMALETHIWHGVRQMQTADLQTCRLADLQTCRLADLQTCRPADL